MATSSTMEATITGTGSSDWIHAAAQARYRIDVDVPAGVSGIAYTIETTHNDSTGLAKTLKQPSDVATDWSFDGSDAINVWGNAFYRINCSSFTGTGTVTMSMRVVEAPGR